MLSSKVEGFKARLAVQELVPEHKNEQKHPNCGRGTRNEPMRGQKRIFKKALGEGWVLNTCDMEGEGGTVGWKGLHTGMKAREMRGGGEMNQN